MSSLPTVFISYARNDSATVLPFADALRAHGVSVWLDQTSIRASTPWRAEITKAIRSAQLFLAIDSASWRQSAACAEELRAAQELRKSILTVDRDDADLWMDLILQRVNNHEEREQLRSTLLGDSFRWQAAGRRRRTLPRGRQLSKFVRLRRSGAHLDTIARSYLAAGIRARRLRRIAAVIVFCTPVLLWSARSLTNEVGQRLEAAQHEKLAELGRLQAVREASARDGYEGAAAAAAFAAKKPNRFFATSTLTAELDSPLPSTVQTSNSAASSTRVAPLEDGASATHGAVLVRWASERHAFDVLRDEMLFSTIPMSGSPTALSLSPDARFIAVATDKGILIINIQHGTTLMTFRGFEGSLHELTWQGDDLIGRSQSAIATWRMPHRDTLLSDGGRFVAMSSSTDGRQGVVTESGELISIENSQPSPPIDLPVTRASDLVWESGTWVVAGLTQEGKGVLIVVKEGHSDTISLGECRPAQITPTGQGRVGVTCPLTWKLLVVELSTKTSRAVEMDIQPVSAVYLGANEWLVNSYVSETVRVDAAGTVEMVGQWMTGCRNGASQTARASDGRIATTGMGARTGCTRLRLHPDDIARASAFIPSQPEMTFGRAVTWSSDSGLLALGFSNGAIQVINFANDDFTLAGWLNPTGSEVRGLAFVDGDNSLLVATTDGDLVSLPTARWRADTEQLISDLQQQVEVGRSAGATP